MVKNVEIIEPYSVNFKKNKIIDKAFNSAFNVLIAKIVISDDLSEVKNVNTMLIKSMVDSFTITNEQFIENNYLAKINVSFDKKKVLNFKNKKLSERREIEDLRSEIDELKNQLRQLLDR